MRYKVVPERPEGGLSAPESPGCHPESDTGKEAVENSADAVGEYLEVVAELSGGEITREVEV